MYVIINCNDDDENEFINYSVICIMSRKCIGFSSNVFCFSIRFICNMYLYMILVKSSKNILRMQNSVFKTHISKKKKIDNFNGFTREYNNITSSKQLLCASSFEIFIFLFINDFLFC